MRHFIILIIVFLSLDGIAQDERFTRAMVTGDLTKEREFYELKKLHFQVQSKPLFIDLDKDSLEEYIVWERRDGENFFTILDPNKKVIKSFWLEAIGRNPHLYRISFRDLGQGIKLFLLSFYEGDVDYLKYQSTVRLHMVTFRDNDFRTFHHEKGPPIWEEHENGHKHYHQRQYPYYLKDFNKDGIKELFVEVGGAQWVYMFRGEKEGWLKI